ncbi:hypothetical protein U1Q18_027482, partial [Sarracenia purpurea var. burkii]
PGCGKNSLLPNEVEGKLKYDGEEESEEDPSEENGNESFPPLLEGEPEATSGAAAVAKIKGTTILKVGVGDSEGTTYDEKAYNEDRAEMPVSASAKVSYEVDIKLNLAENCAGDGDVGSFGGSTNKGIQIDEIIVQAYNAHQVFDGRPETSLGKERQSLVSDVNQITSSGTCTVDSVLNGSPVALQNSFSDPIADANTVTWANVVAANDISRPNGPNSGPKQYGGRLNQRSLSGRLSERWRRWLLWKRFNPYRQSLREPSRPADRVPHPFKGNKEGAKEGLLSLKLRKPRMVATRNPKLAFPRAHDKEPFGNVGQVICSDQVVLGRAELSSDQPLEHD